jgi:hypothetical protein
MDIDIDADFGVGSYWRPEARSRRPGNAWTVYSKIFAWLLASGL